MATVALSAWLLGSAVWASLAAAGGSPTITDVVTPLASLGVAGLWLVLFLTGKLVTAGECDRRVSEIVGERDRLRRVADRVVEEFLPQMLQQTGVLQELATQVKALADREYERQIRADEQRRRPGGG